MKKKKNETLKITWIMTAVYWVVGLLCMFWGKLDHVFSGQLKDINNVYALTLLIVLILPLLFFNLIIHESKAATSNLQSTSYHNLSVSRNCSRDGI